jgi:hypothetical protein
MTRPRSDTATARDRAAARGAMPADPAAAAAREQGTEPEERWAAASMAGRARRDGLATAYRLRRQLLPHAAAASVLGAGLAAEAVANTASISAPALSAMVATLTAPVAVWASRRVRARRPRWARRTLLAGLGAAGWLTLAPFGVGTGDVAVLTALEMAVAARWWQTCRIGYPTADDATTEQAAPAEAALTLPEQIIADWDTNAAVKDGPAPGSRLFDPEPGRYGWAFTLKLSPGKQVFPAILSHLDKIASALDVGVTALVLEQHPDHQAPHWCRLQVITDSPITGDVDFDGPRRHSIWNAKPGYGILEIGPYADGSGEALWQLYTPGSMWSGVVIGAPGIGKSRVIENIVISAISEGDTEFWFIDPNQGASSPALARHADWFTTDQGAGDVLEALLAILDARGEESGVEGWTGFTPSPARPGLLVVIDESHRVFTPDNAVLWARVAREGRKLGVALLVVSQYAGLETFGNKEALRSCIMVGNAIAMHVRSKSGKGLMAGLEVDPLKLPNIPGYGFTLATENNPRTAPFRNRNTAPAGDDAMADRWLAQQPRPGLDTLSATATLAAGTAYRDRHTSSSTGRAAAARRVAMLRDGHLPDHRLRGTTTQATTAPTSSGDGEYGRVITFPTYDEHLRAAQQATEQTPEQTMARPAEPAAEGTAHATAAKGRPTHLGSSYQAVWDAVADGATRPAAIAAHVGLSRRQVQDLLKELLAAGYLTQPKYGHYAVAA